MQQLDGLLLHSLMAWVVHKRTCQEPVGSSIPLGSCLTHAAATYLSLVITVLPCCREPGSCSSSYALICPDSRYARTAAV